MPREFITPLHERRRLAVVQKNTYWTDPAFRLRSINRWRVWKGREPYQSLEQVKSQGPRG